MSCAGCCAGLGWPRPKRRAADDARTAARYAEAAIATDPLDEVAYRWYMSACAAAGEPAKALVAYAELRERLAAELGADPASPTRELHLAILREQPLGRPDRRQALLSCLGSASQPLASHSVRPS